MVDHNPPEIFTFGEAPESETNSDDEQFSEMMSNFYEKGFYYSIIILRLFVVKVILYFVFKIQSA